MDNKRFDKRLIVAVFAKLSSSPKPNYPSTENRFFFAPWNRLHTKIVVYIRSTEDTHTVTRPNNFMKERRGRRINGRQTGAGGVP